MKTQHNLPAFRQRGVMLLEALIAILIFSIGILAIVALQANSIKLASDSKYRSDANLLANRLIGEMWLAHSAPNFATAYQTGGASYTAWANTVAATLPTTGASAPTVTIVPFTAAASTPSNAVTINVFWTVPGENTGTATGHQYSTLTQITN
ncbi:type IV pilus modification PilV family protein [Sideroxydans lithotrophicus]|uniref:Type IV pilus modification protein PilV n=1 Tax=Sideroxydans lithotrophicus (strain ES-1) TaxID=580332 RepID=D5CU00_SIDLE|nr:hypothetical protein [Sideroxydans lithotrophicus]ADE12312.1 type IV pilus modification protein PilV [Sideroxydans lithotrophicus ES-1]